MTTLFQQLEALLQKRDDLDKKIHETLEGIVASDGHGPFEMGERTFYIAKSRGGALGIRNHKRIVPKRVG